MSNTHFSTKFEGNLKVLAIWPDGTRLRDTTGKARAPLQAVEGCDHVLGRLDAAIARVKANTDLSAQGQKKEVAKLAANSLKEIGRELRRLDADTTNGEMVEEKLVNLAIGERAKDDVRGTLIDLAVAERLRETDHAKINTRLRLDELPRDELYAIATLPPILTGMKPDMIDRARINLVYKTDPVEATNIQSDMETRAAANTAIAKAYELVAAKVDRTERRTADEMLFDRYEKTTRQQFTPDPQEAEHEENDETTY